MTPDDAVDHDNDDLHSAPALAIGRSSAARAELIALVERLLNPQPADTDTQQQEWLDVIKASVPDPNVSRYIFWDHDGETAEQIVDKALTYKPIQL